MRKVVLCEGNNKMAICMEDCVFMKETRQSNENFRQRKD